MSSVHRTTIASALLLLASSTTPGRTQDLPANTDGAEWDRARAALQTLPPGNAAGAVARWKILRASDDHAFADFADFLLSYPGFPEESKLRLAAERALVREVVPPQRVAAFFDRFAPVSNQGRAQYALALYALGRVDARDQARQAWRAGAMSDVAEDALLARLGSDLSAADDDARMDSLLWSGQLDQATRQLARVSAAQRTIFAARLAMLGGTDPVAAGQVLPADARPDAGYYYNRSRYLRAIGQDEAAVTLLASRPPLPAPARDPRRWIAELLSVARKADATGAARIAALADDGFAPGTDVSLLPLALRDDYTSLMWLGGTRALSRLGDGSYAAPLFSRYGAAARTPQTRSKGFFWAGRALAKAGNKAEAQRYFEMAAAYPDQFYGMLALEELGRPMPSLASAPSVVPTAAERAAFAARPLTQAVREVARGTDWPTTVRFFREIAEQADSEADHVLVLELARELGRRDLAVILGQAVHVDGHGIYRTSAFPLIPVPQGADWTMVHAISRQESQFAQHALSRAGARGLMQLMPSTAREQAEKMGLGYDASALLDDGGYNLALGDGYFRRLLTRFDGSYPLAVAAYNAGAGNVRKWLAANGDPRAGTIDWIDWIEQIPLSETRNYVQRVLENAVVYEALNPARASWHGGNALSHFLGRPPADQLAAR